MCEDLFFREVHMMRIGAFFSTTLLIGGIVMAPAWAAEPLKVGFMTVSSGALAAGGRQLFDEPSEGLAPQIVTEVAAVLRRLHESGLSIVLVEQNIKLALEIADEVWPKYRLCRACGRGGLASH
jgi:ABC-type cobalamin transport system ATPase subunit